MATFEIEHNGQTFEVEAPSQEAAIQAFRRHIGPASEPMTTGEKVGEAVNRAADGVSFGFADNINAAGDALFRGGLLGQDRSDAPTWRERYNENLDFYRENEDRFREEHPYIAGGAELAGGLLTAGGAAKSGATLLKGGMSAGKAAGRGALEGAAYGAAYGAGSADGENVGQGALMGAAIGAPVGGVSSALGQLMANRAANKGRQSFATLEDLEAAKRQAYQRVDDLGVQYKPEAIDSLVTGIEDGAKAGHIHPQRHPRASSMVDDFGSMRGQPQSLTELDQMRQVVRRDVAGVPDPAEAYFGRNMIAEIDDFVNAAGPHSVTGGDAPAAAEAIGQARHLNARAAKYRTVSDAINSAELRAASTNSGANTGNAIRQNLRRVMEQSQKRGKGNFSPLEQDLLDRAVRGGPMQNSARGVGKAVGGGLGLLAGVATGRPIAMAAHLGGKAAQRLDQTITHSNANALLAHILKGGAPKQGSQSMRANTLQKLLINHLVSAGSH